MRSRSTRRGFLSAAGLAGIGAGLGLGADQALGEATGHAAQASGPVPFFGPHQAGITTATPGHVQFAALDLVSHARSDLRAVLAQLSAAAAELTRGLPVGSARRPHPSGQPELQRRRADPSARLRLRRADRALERLGGRRSAVHLLSA